MGEPTLSGPLFDGGFELIMRDYTSQAEIDIANQGERILRTNLHTTLKHPTGKYESHIESDGNVISDDRSVYGPWLEGTGSRNKTTKFKGYANFRRTAQELQTRAAGIANLTLKSFIGRMG